jgi:hypothetical protein
MSRNLALVLIGLLGSLVAPASVYAQLTPPAGSAGAGNSAISGVPFGPANPSVLPQWPSIAHRDHDGDGRMCDHLNHQRSDDCHP